MDGIPLSSRFPRLWLEIWSVSFAREEFYFFLRQCVFQCLTILWRDSNELALRYSIATHCELHNNMGSQKGPTFKFVFHFRFSFSIIYLFIFHFSFFISFFFIFHFSLVVFFIFHFSLVFFFIFHFSLVFFFIFQ